MLIHPDPRLHQRCEPAGSVSGQELRTLTADLLATMYEAGGRGLAAPQIGVMLRAFVMDAHWKEGRPDPQVMLDPEILSRSVEEVAAVEQCLSIPDQPVEVLRSASIAIAWYDLDGHHHERTLSGIEARIFQHEADHLDGRLIVDPVDGAE
ncbi:peptide deformylase [Paracoccus caeni]|uniref:Peptide deformylase n=1 Tax=Paracoccus caeni TaxID=657651 RepID=A0A934SHW0_9RHOB|nr:peptide deformylase [Paracoccus caeni]